LNKAVGKYFNETFFKVIMGQERGIRERILMGERDFKVDFVEFFANIINGSPCEIA